MNKYRKQLLGDLLGQFGIKVGSDEEPIRAPVEPIDPDAAAELEGSLIMSSRKEQLYNQQLQQRQANAVDESDPVDAEGDIDFDLLFRKVQIPASGFTAEQAMEAIHSLDATIPPMINDQAQRRQIIRNMLLAVNKGPAAAEKIVLDAHNKQKALDDLLSAHTDMLVEYRQHANDAVKQLEEKIAAIRSSQAAAERQYDTMAKNCKDRQAAYDQVIDFLGSTAPD